MKRMQHLDDYRARAAEAAAFLSGQGLTPIDVVVECGSGLSGLAAVLLTDPRRLPLSEIPQLAPATVAGHGRDALWAMVGDLGVLVLTGRVHLYEGHSSAQAGFPAAMASATGARLLVLTNAAGALNPEYRVGDVMLHSGYLNHQGENPLQHLRIDDPAQRFVSPEPAYHPGAGDALHGELRVAGLTVHRGTYLATHGPVFETQAELKMMRGWGADAVGMSTVPEVIVSHLCRLPVVGLSVITNECFGPGGLTHAEVLAASGQAAPALGSALGSFLREPLLEEKLA